MILCVIRQPVTAGQQFPGDIWVTGHVAAYAEKRCRCFVICQNGHGLPGDVRMRTIVESQVHRRVSLGVAFRPLPRHLRGEGFDDARGGGQIHEVRAVLRK